MALVPRHRLLVRPHRANSQPTLSDSQQSTPWSGISQNHINGHGQLTADGLPTFLIQSSLRGRFHHLLVHLALDP